MLILAKLLPFGLTAAAAIFMSYAASAQFNNFHAAAQPVPVCFRHDELRDNLGQSFQERQAAYGRAGDTALMEVFASESGTWTMVLTNVAGVSCIIAAGDGWETPTITALNGA